MANQPSPQRLAAQELLERLSDFQLRGVSHFPIDGIPAPQAPQPVQTTSDAAEAKPRLCSLCPVCSPVGGRFLADDRAMLAGRILVVLEFPGVETSVAEDLASPSGANHLIDRLLRRAGLVEDCAFAYALRSPPQGAPAAESVAACGRQWLAREIAARSPEVILCFGARAAAAVEVALKIRASAAPPWAGGIKFFPAPHELVAYPAWRRSVWDEVSALTPGNA